MKDFYLLSSKHSLVAVLLLSLFQSHPHTGPAAEQSSSQSRQTLSWEMLEITEQNRLLFILDSVSVPFSSRHELSEYIAAPLFKKQPPQQWVTMVTQHMQQVQTLNPHQARAQFLGKKLHVYQPIPSVSWVGYVDCVSVYAILYQSQLMDLELRLLLRSKINLETYKINCSQEEILKLLSTFALFKVYCHHKEQDLCPLVTLFCSIIILKQIKQRMVKLKAPEVQISWVLVSRMCQASKTLTPTPPIIQHNTVSFNRHSMPSKHMFFKLSSLSL